MLSKLFIIFISLVLGSSFILQTDKSFKTIVFKQKYCNVQIDDFGNAYIISKMEILKYNAAGELIKSFSTKRYGSIDFVDVTNPLKILVYYKDFQQILFLDNQLTASSNMISLEVLGLEQTSLVCTSANNSFWLYDKQNNSLQRFGEKSQQLVKIDNLKRVLDIDIKPNFMKEKSNYLYLNCPNEGILVFDIYGSFLKTIPIKNISEFDIQNNNVFYFQNKTLNEYSSQTFNTTKKVFNDSLLKTVYWQSDKFYKVFQDSLSKEILK